jgi:hypothetical protein
VGKHQQQPPNVDKVAVIQSCVVPSETNTTGTNFANAIKETGAKPYEETLTADFSQETNPTTSDEVSYFGKTNINLASILLFFDWLFICSTDDLSGNQGNVYYNFHLLT